MSPAYVQHVLRTAWRSLARQRMRSTLSGVGVSLGIVSLVTTVSVGEGAKRKTLEQIEQLGVQNIIVRTARLTDAEQRVLKSEGSRGLSPSDVASIAAVVPDCELVAPIREARTKFAQTPDFHPDVLGVSVEYQTVNALALDEGRFICDLDARSSNLVCVIGHDVAEQLGPAGHVGGVLRIAAEMFRVVGVLRPVRSGAATDSAVTLRDLNRVVLVPLPAIRAIDAAADADAYSEIVVRASAPSRVSAVAAGVGAVLEFTHRGVRDYQIVVPLELIARERQARRNFDLMLSAIALVSLLVGGIGIMNIMLASVSERTHEIGVRRALGATQRDIRIQFLAESILISVVGGGIGVVAGIALILVVAVVGAWAPTVSVWLLVFSLATALTVGAFAGLYPATRASRMDPVEALRQH